MEIFRVQEFLQMANPKPGARFTQRILTGEQRAENLIGIVGLLPPGVEVPYHYHNKRECIIMAISGEAVEMVEGKEIPLKANDVIYIPAKEKHGTVNRTDQDFRYLEFFTGKQGEVDIIQVK